jgi:hypothetical protein
VLFFWVVTPCRLVGRYQSFGETYCLHLRNGIYLRIHTASQPKKNNVVIFTAVRTSNLTLHMVADKDATNTNWTDINWIVYGTTVNELSFGDSEPFRRRRWRFISGSCSKTRVSLLSLYFPKGWFLQWSCLNSEQIYFFLIILTKKRNPNYCLTQNFNHVVTWSNRPMCQLTNVVSIYTRTSPVGCSSEVVGTLCILKTLSQKIVVAVKKK